MTASPPAVWIVTVLPLPGTVPAKLTTPPAGASTDAPSAAADRRCRGAGPPRTGAPRRTRSARAPAPTPARSKRPPRERRRGRRTRSEPRRRMPHPPPLLSGWKTVVARYRRRRLLSMDSVPAEGAAVEPVARDAGQPRDDLRRPPAGKPCVDELGHGRERRRLRRAPTAPGPRTSVISPFGGSAKRSASSAAVPRTTSSKRFVSSRQTATGRAGSAAASERSVAGSRCGDSNATAGHFQPRARPRARCARSPRGTKPTNW